MKKFNVYIDDTDECYVVYATNLYLAISKFSHEYPVLAHKVTDVCTDWLYKRKKKNA